jgi:hypothetical protein
MIFNLATFTAIHTALSLVALGAGVVVVIGLFGAQLHRFWTDLFLVTAVATSATGFAFPFNGVLPSHVLAVIALLVLAAVIVARHVTPLVGAWRLIYALGIVASVYFLVFVVISQAFLKVPLLSNIAPTSTEPPFVVAQVIALVVFVGIAVAAVRSSRRAAVPITT